MKWAGLGAFPICLRPLFLLLPHLGKAEEDGAEKGT